MIKKFKKFISEELHILTHQSSSGRTKEFDVILDDPSTNLSASAGILLRQRLKREEIQEVHNILNHFNCPITLNDAINYENAIKLNNFKFLKDRKSENISLYCEYCNRGPLKIYGYSLSALKRGRFFSSFNAIDGATCDHKEPISKGGDVFNYNNLAVCCSSCNEKKGNMTWENWIKEINLKE